jgi:hypothetical protein
LAEISFADEVLRKQDGNCTILIAGSSSWESSGEFISEITLPIRCVTNLCDV